MPYNYPFKPWFNLASAPKPLFWPLLIGSILFWFCLSIGRSVLKMLMDIVEAVNELAQKSCCWLRFVSIIPFFLLAMCIMWPVGVWFHLKPDMEELWSDTKYTIQWHRKGMV